MLKFDPWAAPNREEIKITEDGEEILNKYETIKQISSGLFSIVYEAKNKLTGEIVAKKQIRLNNNDTYFRTIKEVQFLQMFQNCAMSNSNSNSNNSNSNNIIQVKDIVWTKTDCFIFMPMMKDLSKYITNDNLYKTYIQPNIPILLKQLLQATNDCHKGKIIHRDIKPQNILLSVDNNNNSHPKLVLTDFNTSCTFGTVGDRKNAYVPLMYQSPELLLGSVVYEKSLDIWSVGCVFAEMLLTHSIFPYFEFGEIEPSEFCKLVCVTLGIESDSDNNHDHTCFIQNSRALKLKECVENANITNAFVNAGIDLLSKMLDPNPDTRITAEDALKHPYINS